MINNFIDRENLYMRILSAYTTPSSPYSVTCTSRDTNEHVNPMLEIDNGAVSIPDSYIRNDWPNSTTLNAPRGLAESGLEGYYTCRTEEDTFFSPHILHSSKSVRIEHCMHEVLIIILRLCPYTSCIIIKLF